MMIVIDIDKNVYTRLFDNGIEDNAIANDDLFKIAKSIRTGIPFNYVKNGRKESVRKESKTGHCKDCKYFEYDSVAKVDGIPLIVAHEICKRWGDGCKTREDGYCFMYVPKTESEEESHV